MRSSRWQRHLVLSIVLTMGLSACASVKVNVPGFQTTEIAENPHRLSERIALVEAANALADQPWGRSAEGSMLSVLFNPVLETDRDRLIDQYLAGVAAAQGDPVAQIIADADRSLADARRVAEAGRQALAALQPLPADISTLETAIGEARECRTVYVRALELLQRSGAQVSAAEAQVIRDAFTQTITDIAHTADLVAMRAAHDTGRDQWATSAPTRFGAGVE